MCAFPFQPFVLARMRVTRDRWERRWRGGETRLCLRESLLHAILLPSIRTYFVTYNGLGLYTCIYVCVHARIARYSMASLFHEGGRTSLFDPGTIVPPESKVAIVLGGRLLRPRETITVRIAFATSSTRYSFELLARLSSSSRSNWINEWRLTIGHESFKQIDEKFLM